MEKKGYSLLHVIIIIVVTAIVSGMTIGMIFMKGSVSSEGISYSHLLTDDNVKEFLDVYSSVVNGYYQNVDKKQAIEKAIDGMMDYLDDTYTTHLNQDEASILLDQLNGTYDGIGVTIRENKIINVIGNSPAERAGLKPGDIIIKVNNEVVEGKSAEEIVTLIKNDRKNVVIEINRNGQSLIFNMSMETLSKPNVSYNIVEDTNIGYIQISVFGNNLSTEVKNALDFLKQGHMEKLIIDVRGNSGGYLNQAYDTASLFLENGKIVYSLSDKSGTENFKDKDNMQENYPIVVLVNGTTASAAEILAAALKDSYGAVLLGTTTYGKGKVQQTYSLNNGGLVKYTSSKWLRPNGSCIDGIGITPDHLVENEYIYDEDTYEYPVIVGIIDNQYNRAIELLK